MHRVPALAICEPVEALRSDLEDGARNAGYCPTTFDDVTDLALPDFRLVIAYVDRSNLDACSRLVQSGIELFALHDARSNLSISLLIGTGARMVLPRGVGANAVSHTLTADASQLMIIPRRPVRQERFAERAAAVAALTHEESSWLAAAACGRTIEQIARDTGQSEQTLQRRLREVYRKLSAPNLAGALVVASVWGLVPPPG